MGTTIGTLAAFITANVAGFKAGMQEATGELNRFVKNSSKIDRNLMQLGKKFTEFGKTLSASVTLPIVALGVTSVKAFDEAAKGEAKLTSALKLSGQAVGPVLKDFKDFASQIQSITTIDDDAVIGMLQMATSMGLSAEAAKKAATNAIGLSAAFGISEEAALKAAAAIESGDATLIKRYIPTLKEVEDESLVVALAQKAMADGFEAAKAAALAGLGPWEQLGNMLGNLSEDFGKIILEGLQPLIKKTKSLTERLSGLSDTTKKTIVVISGIAAAIGPGMLAMGLMTTKVLPLLKMGLLATKGAFVALNTAMLANPWVLAAAGITAIGVGLLALAEPTDAARKSVKKLTQAEEDWLKMNGMTSFSLDENTKAIEVNEAKTKEIARAMALAAEKRKQMQIEFLKKLPVFDVKGIPELDIKPIKAPQMEGMISVWSELNKATEAAKLFSQAFSDKPIETIERERSVLKQFIETSIAAEGQVSEDTQAMINNYNQLGEQLATLETQELGFWGQKLPEAMKKSLAIASEVTGAINAISSASFSLMSTNLDIQSAKLDERYNKEIALMELTATTDEARQKDRAKIDAFFAKERSDILKKQAKQQKAAALMAAIVNTAQAVVSALGFGPPPVGIAFAAIIGALGVAQITTIASQSIPSAAKGGMAFSETLAVVGDNPNVASDPEVISPLSKLQDMFQMGKQELTAVIRGEDLILVTDRVKRNRGFIQ